MSADGIGDPPPYIIPVEGKDDDVKIYHLHAPFNPPASTIEDTPTVATPVYATEAKNKYVSYEMELGRSPGMATCTTCQQQVMSNVDYRVGSFAWLMCFVFILCGLVVGCCLLPFFLKHFKDAYHSCPRCNQILHVEKKRCC